MYPSGKNCPFISGKVLYDSPAFVAETKLPETIVIKHNKIEIIINIRGIFNSIENSTGKSCSRVSHNNILNIIIAFIKWKEKSILANIWVVV